MYRVELFKKCNYFSIVHCHCLGFCEYRPSMADLIVPWLQKLEGSEETTEVIERPKTTEEPKIATNSPTETEFTHFKKMAKIVCKLVESPSWKSLSTAQKKMIAKFLMAMASPSFFPKEARKNT